ARQGRNRPYPLSRRPRRSPHGDLNGKRKPGPHAALRGGPPRPPEPRGHPATGHARQPRRPPHRRDGRRVSGEGQKKKGFLSRWLGTDASPETPRDDVAPENATPEN